MTKRFLSIGECMVEMAPAADGNFGMGFAGDTLNTAWYVRRELGEDWDVAYFTAVGNDAISNRMIAFLDASHITTGLIRRIPDRTVGLYLIQLDNGERSFAYWRSESAARRLAADAEVLKSSLAAADLIYFSGITVAILPPSERQTLLTAIAGARANGATIAFDPNLRPRLWEDADTMRNAVMDAAAVSDILLPSFEDEASAYEDRDIEDTARRYAGQGVPVVIVKNGAGEMLALDRGNIQRFKPDPVASVVDTTAAGDSFNAAYLASYLRSGELRPALEAGAALAARVIGRRGALVVD
ncbi:MAG: sugar kinase [Hoeflea sp.]|uniref:sugar kinase n=1 Tax=Hoeflea sp. TaxID=1940281 RepID=UPI0032EDB53B